jgi:hypothetical protein
MNITVHHFSCEEKIVNTTETTSPKTRALANYLPKIKPRPASQRQLEILEQMDDAQLCEQCEHHHRLRLAGAKERE